MDKYTLRRIKTLHPEIRQASFEIVEDAYLLGIPIRITSAYRDFDEQNILYNKGRTQPGKIVTNALPGFSWHNYGLAFDFVLLSHDGTQVFWNIERDLNNNNKKDWIEVATIAKSFGFEWGGDWSNPDYPHLQKTFDLDIDEAMKMLEDGNVDKNGYIKIKKNWLFD